jgi:hypothetical protein
MKTKRKLVEYAMILLRERRQNTLNTAKRCIVKEEFEYEPVGSFRYSIHVPYRPYSQMMMGM